MTHVTSIK